MYCLNFQCQRLSKGISKFQEAKRLLLDYLFAYSVEFPTLKMNFVRFYETSANSYQTVRNFIRENNTVHYRQWQTQMQYGWMTREFSKWCSFQMYANCNSEGKSALLLDKWIAIHHASVPQVSDKTAGFQFQTSIERWRCYHSSFVIPVWTANMTEWYSCMSHGIPQSYTKLTVDIGLSS
jgi:hypothetical protein